jgi:formylglycine-generating enzyme required for sulfatase activity
MGSQKGDEDAYEDEQPQHEVDLPAYWISRYPVTNGQYDQFVQANGYGQESYWPEAQAAGVWKDGKVKGWRDDEPRNQPANYGDPFNLSNHPVVGVTWYEALAFTRWLTDYWYEQEILPKDWRVVLPSEAEWEKAARGGLKIPQKHKIQSTSDELSFYPNIALRNNSLPNRKFPWGKSFDPDKANIGTVDLNTSAPGCFSNGSSPYGVIDMSGNVWEWTSSIKKQYPYDPSDGRENLKADCSIHRVLRGGSFSNILSNGYCTSRPSSSPEAFHRTGGFRLMVSLRNKYSE